MCVCLRKKKPESTSVSTINTRQHIHCYSESCRAQIYKNWSHPYITPVHPVPFLRLPSSPILRRRPRPPECSFRASDEKRFVHIGRLNVHLARWFDLPRRLRFFHPWLLSTLRLFRVHEVLPTIFPEPIALPIIPLLAILHRFKGHGLLGRLPSGLNSGLNKGQNKGMNSGLDYGHNCGLKARHQLSPRWPLSRHLEF